MTAFGARAAVTWLAAFLITACSSPTLDVEDTATGFGLDRETVRGTSFRHVVFQNDGAHSETLHIYIHGDGTPWIGGRPALDPTPRNPLVLRLLSLDRTKSIYLGRPCYHGEAESEECASPLWTNERYSEEVIASLAAAARRLIDRDGYRKVTWIGHSGGGTLAVLLALRFRETVSVVTIAANFDTHAWAKASWGGDLSASLNPANGAPLPRHIRQMHYAGRKDTVVPLRFTAPGAERLGGKLIIMDDFNHACCWEKIWLDVLEDEAKAPR